MLTQLVPHLVLAADAAKDIALPAWAQAAIAIGGLLATALGAALGRALHAALTQLFAFLAQKTKIAKLAELDGVVYGFVAEVAQAEVAAAKEAAADGKITPEEAAKFKQIAIDKVKEHFGLAHLADLLGDQLESYLGSRVEKAVVDQKAAPANP